MTTILQRAFDIDERPLEVTPPEHRHYLATRRRLTGPGLRAFFNVAREWDLSNEEQQALLGWPALEPAKTGQPSANGQEEIPKVVAG